MPPRGPQEIEGIIRAFTRMRERLHHFNEDRTCMMGSVFRLRKGRALPRCLVLLNRPMMAPNVQSRANSRGGVGGHAVKRTGAACSRLPIKTTRMLPPACHQASLSARMRTERSFFPPADVSHLHFSKGRFIAIGLFRCRAFTARRFKTPTAYHGASCSAVRNGATMCNDSPSKWESTRPKRAFSYC